MKNVYNVLENIVYIELIIQKYQNWNEKEFNV